MECDFVLCIISFILIIIFLYFYIYIFISFVISTSALSAMKGIINIICY